MKEVVNEFIDVSRIKADGYILDLSEDKQSGKCECFIQKAGYGVKWLCNEASNEEISIAEFSMKCINNFDKYVDQYERMFLCKR